MHSTVVIAKIKESLNAFFCDISVYITSGYQKRMSIINKIFFPLLPINQGYAHKIFTKHIPKVKHKTTLSAYYIRLT